MPSEQYYAWQYLPWKHNLFCFLCLFVSSYLFAFVYGVILLFSSGWKRWTLFYHYSISGSGKILNYNGLRQMGLINLQWDFKFEICQGISDWEFHCEVPLSLFVVLFLTRDVAFLFSKICLSIAANGSYNNPQPRWKITHYLD